MYHFKGKKIRGKSFNDFNKPFCFLKKIREGNVMLEKANEIQNMYKSDLNEIKKEDANQKRKKAHCIILRCFTKQETVLLFDDYSSMISETEHGSIHGEKNSIS